MLHRLRDHAWWAKEWLLCLLRHDYEPLKVDPDGFVQMICITCGKRKMSRPAGL